VVYGRTVGERELNFEASGALMEASLVMRDRETDSWWSIMTSDAIGGPLDGSDLEELPYGEKTTWGDWMKRHPETLVLSVDGEEHVLNNPYDNYFSSESTFRNLQVDDHRLEPKENIFSFWLDGRAHAVTHRAVEGGKLYRVGEHVLLFYRQPGSSFFASSDAYAVDSDTAEGVSATELIERLGDGPVAGIERLSGFDTFWYSWVAINEDTELLD